MKKIFLPYGSKRRRLARSLLVRAGLIDDKDNAYGHWVRTIEPYMLSSQGKYKYNPLISIIVPAYNTPNKYLQPLIYSIINQSYQNWELILVNASNNKRSKTAIDAIAEHDVRIKIVTPKRNMGIAGNTNLGINKARGEYTCFVDHDDLLSRFALAEVIAALQDPQNRPDLIYTDEDKLSENGNNRIRPHFKPDWSPDMLRFANYITHLLVVRTELLHKVGGLDKKLDGAQDFDLILRLSEQTSKIQHIPKTLYHWREAKGSTAIRIQHKKYATEAGVSALKNHLRRIGTDADVWSIEGKPAFYQVRYKVSKKEPVLILINKKLPIICQQIIESKVAENTEYKNYDIKTWSKMTDLKTVPSSYKYLVVINDFVWPLYTGWLSELVGLLNQAHVGAAMPRVANNEWQVVDVGLIKQQDGYKNLFKGIGVAEDTYFGAPDWLRNVSALSGRIFAVRQATLSKHMQATDFDSRYEFSIKPDFFERLVKNGLYNTVWTHITWIAEEANLTMNSDRLYNQNLTIGQKGQVALLASKKEGSTNG